MINSINSNELLIAITFDLDPDAHDMSIDDRYRQGCLSWKGIEEGIPLINKLLRQIKFIKERPNLTWFVRVDNQIKSLYGDSCYIYDLYIDLLNECRRNGDEIAWHPHLYMNEDGNWTQETDETKLESYLIESFESIKKRDWHISSVRIGENYCSESILSTLDRLAIKFDSTAMPGRERNDRQRNFDWSETPETPYQPSKRNFRVAGKPSYNIIELPFTMKKIKAEYDENPLLRYIDLSFHPEILKPALSDIAVNNNFLITVTHPSCLMPDVFPSRHGLLAYSECAFKENLTHLLAECEANSRKYRFVGLSQGARDYLNKNTFSL